MNQSVVINTENAPTAERAEREHGIQDASNEVRIDSGTNLDLVDGTLPPKQSSLNAAPDVVKRRPPDPSEVHQSSTGPDLIDLGEVAECFAPTVPPPYQSASQQSVSLLDMPIEPAAVGGMNPSNAEGIR